MSVKKVQRKPRGLALPKFAADVPLFSPLKSATYFIRETMTAFSQPDGPLAKQVVHTSFFLDKKKLGGPKGPPNRNQT